MRPLVTGNSFTLGIAQPRTGFVALYARDSVEMQACQPCSIGISSVANPPDDWLPEPEVGDGKRSHESDHDDGVGDRGAPMNASARQ